MDDCKSLFSGFLLFFSIFSFPHQCRKVVGAIKMKKMIAPFCLNVTSSLLSVQDSSSTDLVTPKIDQAMEMFRRRQIQMTPSSTDTSVIQSVTDTELQSPGSSRVRSRTQVSGLMAQCRLLASRMPGQSFGFSIGQIHTLNHFHFSL